MELSVGEKLQKWELFQPMHVSQGKSGVRRYSTFLFSGTHDETGNYCRAQPLEHMQETVLHKRQPRVPMRGISAHPAGQIFFRLLK